MYFFLYRSNLNSKEDRIHVESQLCLATQGPLCLDPDPVVSIIARYVKLISTSVSADKPMEQQNYVYFAENHVFDVKNLPLQQ